MFRFNYDAGTTAIQVWLVWIVIFVALFIFSFFALVANIAVLIYMIYKISKTNRNPYKGELYTDLAKYKEVKALAK